MNRTLLLFAILSVGGCAYQPAAEQSAPVTSTCVGDTALPENLTDKFVATEDQALLDKALGAPNAGGLCQGQVYQSKAKVEIPLYRAWNSTNPNSRLGNWWAFDMPTGKVATYRADYEICYQWSPLDKLETCTLQPGTKVVVGTGQSAQCSQYLSYPVSDAQQIYIEDAAETMTGCRSYDGEFSWKP
ncbi:hypothetical protein GCM10011352_10740 [Marinobacterium zhoushanense]|uniref:Lipoprotein n=1 Tax=Marinobacterium zhoushanense TaxID=1679163 RepID=A0ABQ1K3R5_9GAMM|nr:hypothetical protein [Marinobacterium zhoushanense]GGB86716.1 hypothetical protein GCM10011352_10740 [Marinobacterium zhoushanense]